ncbi:Capsular polysaccharide biosynthesis protein [Fictibacillus solisalsi]|uniref:Capsular polysaccharide biosynthesis protein n=1 Tax=Fictibacillus solisalsi TaxID=459525 RepID=A0A1G9YFG6_9BACL|nr:Wzz/FepE/Etk N-terminal domain-containing protein [Fictibacillus solisalsi]SDN07807.1 Capsular polysaccharide biosynthesis protein [Fictibacillus solisalsi]
MDERVDIKRFLQIIKRRAFLIILTAIGVSVLTAFITLFLIKPTYEATEYIMIGKQNTKDAYTETQEFSRILASSMDLMKSPIVLDLVKNEMNLNTDLKKLEEQIALQNNKDSQIINIVVKETDVAYAKQLAHTLAKTSVAEINDLLNIKKVKMLNDSEEAVSVKQIGNPYLNIIIGMFVGLFIGVGLAMLVEYFDDSIKDINEVERTFGLSVIGQVKMKQKKERLILFGKRPVKRLRKGREANV